LAVLAAVSIMGCNEQAEPVDIPFEGLEPSVAQGLPSALPPPPSVSPSATSAPTRGVDPYASSAAAVRACCGALSAAARAAKDEGGKAMNQQAAQVCSRKVKPVSEGKLTRAKALSEVRSSLLGPAPAACR
jgi:hypothetical protein